MSRVEQRAWTGPELVGQLEALGVRRGGVLLVHTSFRAVRPVAGGPGGLIAALLAALGPDGTLVMPSWGARADAPFDPAATRAAADLGIVAETFRRRAGTLRAAHPFSFAALGPKAADILRDPMPLPPHGPASPVGRVRDEDGAVLLIGVGHDADTTLHLAEIEGGAPYRTPKRVTVMRAGAQVEIEYGENDHCCRRFALADEWLRKKDQQAEGWLGAAAARLAKSRDIVAAAIERLRADPLIFLHAPSEGCADCDEARASV